MKTLFPTLRLALLLTVLGGLSACDSDNNDILTPNESALTDEEAVEILAASLGSEAEGLSADLTTAAEMADQYKAMDPIPCGSTTDSTYQRNRDTDRVSANYSVNISATPACGPFGGLSSLAYSRSLTGTYVTNRLSSDDNATGNWSLENITSGPEYTVSGNYLRNGTQTVTTNRRSGQYTTQLELSMNDLRVGKQSRQIESGLATFSISGEGSGGRSIDLKGSVTFLGDRAAVVNLNGEQYEIEW